MRYFPRIGAAIPTKFEGRNPDVECEYCGSPCSSKHNNCTNCGGPLAGAPQVHVRASIPSDQNETGADAKRDWEGRRAARRAAQKETNQRPRAKRPQEGRWQGYKTPSASLGLDWPRVGLIAAVGLAFAMFLVAMLWTKNVAVEVQGTSWERKISIEEYQAHSGSDWCDSMPGDAYDIDREERVRSHRKVKDGETCTDYPESCKTTCRNVDNGNGSFSRECTETCREAYTKCDPKYRKEPVYDDYCSWTVNEWDHVRWVVEAGHSDNPQWPQPRLSECKALGCERLGSRKEINTVVFVALSEGVTMTCDFDEARWAEFEVGATWNAKERVIGGALLCQSLSRTP